MTDESVRKRTTAALQKVEQAMLRVGAARQQFIEANQSSNLTDRILRQFHAAVMNYYLELRPYRQNALISEEWETATLWHRDGEEVEGLDHLRSWVSRKRQSESKNPGRGTSSSQNVEPDRLPAEDLLRISLLLDDLAYELGFSAPTKEQTPNDDADRSDLRELLKARGQTEAANRVPAEGDD